MTTASTPPRLGKAASYVSVALVVLIAAWELWTPGSNFRMDYYPNSSMTGAPSSGQVRDAKFDTSKALLPAGFPDREDFSLRLRTCLEVGDEGRFVFRARADDAARVYVDDQLVLDTHDDKRVQTSEPVQLARGWHRLSVEYANASGTARLNVEMAEFGVRTFRSLQARARRSNADGGCDAI